MKQVLQFALDKKCVVLDIPTEEQFLNVKLLNGIPYVFVLVDTARQTRKISVSIYANGEIILHNPKYIDTFNDINIPYHVLYKVIGMTKDEEDSYQNDFR